MRDAITKHYRLRADRLAIHGDAGVERRAGVFVKEQDSHGAVMFAHGVNSEAGIIAGGLEHGFAAAREVREEFVDVERRIAVCGAGGVGGIDDAVIAVLAPAIQRGAVVGAGALTVAKIPPDEAVEFRFHQIAEAVGEEESVDQAGGLLAGIGVHGIVFRAGEFDPFGGVAEVILELLTKIGGIVGPGGRGG